MGSGKLTTQVIWSALEDVKDPEIPVVSLVEMGIIREVRCDGGRVEVIMTPTFAGCPALEVMKRDIVSCLGQLGVDDVEVQMILSPPWTSDWISDEGRAKLRAFGMAPPPRHGGRIELTFYEPVACPRCGSKDTSIRNAFGSTLCRAIYTCNACREPFEQFKAL